MMYVKISNRGTILTVFLLLSSFVAACGESVPSSPSPIARPSIVGPERPVRPSDGRVMGRRDPALLGGGSRFPTFDALLARVAEVAPSFAGLYRGDDEMPTVLLTRMGDLPAVQEALDAILRDDRFSSVQRVEEAAYSFDRLYGWKADLTPLLTLPGVMSLDIDERRNRISIGVLDPSLVISVRRALAGRDVPEEAVVFRISEAPRFGATLHDSWRPVTGGPELETSASLTCTLGFNADLDGTPVFATNGHCTETIGGIEGTDFGQDDYPSDDIGTEYFEEELFSSSENAYCPTSQYKCKYTEVALGEYDDSDDWENGYVLRPIERDPDASSVVVDSLLLGIASEELWPLQNDVVEKIGRTTGWTYGEVDETCATKLVEGYYLLCTYTAEMGGDDGDSGSGVFIDYSGNWMDIVGQYFAQTSTTILFSPWNSIQVIVYNEFNETLDVTP